MYKLKIWYFLLSKVLVFLSDTSFMQFLRVINYFRLGLIHKWYPINYKNPKTFNEKLNILKLDKHYLNYNKYADKVLVRKFVEKKIGDKYLVPLVHVFDDVDQMKIENLPSKFILKTNHGSGWNFICNNKSEIDFPSVKSKFKYFLSLNAFFISREYQYKNIIPKIICEELIGDNINDYKFFCFDGIPKLVQIDHDRVNNHQRSIYTADFLKTKYRIRYSQIEHNIEKPKKFEEMKRLAHILSKDFKFCRVDFYCVNDKVFFGELTFFPGGGQEPFLKFSDDFEMGHLINLNS